MKEAVETLHTALSAKNKKAELRTKFQKMLKPALLRVKKLKPNSYFSFLCFSLTPANNKAIKTIKTKGRGCGEMQTQKTRSLSWPPQLCCISASTTLPARPFPLGVHDRAFGPCRYFGTVSDTLSITGTINGTICGSLMRVPNKKSQKKAKKKVHNYQIPALRHISGGGGGGGLWGGLVCFFHLLSNIQKKKVSTQFYSV